MKTTGGIVITIADDDDTLELYTQQLMDLCAEARRPNRLAGADATVSKRSRLCGSTIALDLSLGSDDRVNALGYEVAACSLGTAATAILNRHAVGSTLGDLQQARQAVIEMLGGAPVISPPAGWDEIGMLAPARDIQSRHSAIKIVFDAVCEAAEQAVNSR